MVNLTSFSVRIKRVLQAILNGGKLSGPFKPQKHEMEAVLDFFCNYNDFRSLSACVKQTGLDIELCARIKRYLYERRMLGLYFFEAGVPPQKYMRQLILSKFPQITNDSYILEVGPGENPLFPISEYQNWYAVDKYLEDGVIKFKDWDWAKKNKYPTERIFQGTFEDLSKIFDQKGLYGRFDLVVASHSYEHVFKPIESLKQANKMLKQGGGFVYLCLMHLLMILTQKTQRIPFILSPK